MSAVSESEVFAFDVPLELSAEDAARLIDEGCPYGFYTAQMLMWPGAGLRVFCKRSKALTPEERINAKQRSADALRKVKDEEDAQADAALAKIVAGSPRITVGVARARLARLGFRRGTDWVTEGFTRAKTRAAL